ncbi:MAG: putative quinol monooxygenase [Actinomycetia bacterium]|nr:putative quinol monooxygenase [Actinomycetes bacterium]
MGYVVTAKWTARPGEEEAVAAAIAKLVGPARKEPGNVVYQPHRDPEDPRVFFFYEEFAGADAYQAHLDSAHMQEYGFGEAIPRLESRERAFFETWEPSDS